MIKNEARLALIIELANISHTIANNFESRFTHQFKERSTNKQEIKEIMGFFQKEFQTLGRPDLANKAFNLSEFSDIDDWICSLKEQGFLYDIACHWTGEFLLPS